MPNDKNKDKYIRLERIENFDEFTFNKMSVTAFGEKLTLINSEEKIGTVLPVFLSNAMKEAMAKKTVDGKRKYKVTFFKGVSAQNHYFTSIESIEEI